MLEVTCPHCGTCVPFVPELVGREIFCLGCGSHYVIPDLRSQATKDHEGPTAKPVVIVPPQSDPSPKEPRASQKPDGGKGTGANG